MEALIPESLNRKFLELTKILSELLEEDLSSDYGLINSPIHFSVRVVVESNRVGDIVLSDFELMKMELLARALQSIQTYDPLLFRKFTRKLKSGREDDYRGVLCEINMAATLINMKVKFKAREHPDFLIERIGKPVFIECTSADSTNTGKMNPVDRIAAKVQEKTNKSYCNNFTALAIDITNIEHQSEASISQTPPESLRWQFRDVLKSTAYGSLLLYMFVVDYGRTVPIMFWAYNRIDNLRPSKQLIRFLDKHFSMGSHVINVFGFPRLGTSRFP